MSRLAAYRPYIKENTKLALPMIAGQLGHVMVNLIDNLMVGRISVTALAAVALGNAIFIAALVLGLGLSFALPPLISEQLSAGKRERLSDLASHSMYINVIFAVVATSILVLGASLLDQIGQDPAVVKLAKPYLQIGAFSLIPLMIFQTLRCYSDGWEDTMSPAIAILIGNVINVLLNYILIFGKWGAPELGVTGAALGTLITRILIVFILLALLYRKKEAWSYLKKMTFKIRKTVVRKLLSLGVPNSMQMFFEIAAFSGATLIMGLLSKEVQAAHQISINLASITFLICSGVGMAATVLVGKYYGLRDGSQIKLSGLGALIEVTAVMIVCAFLFVVLRFYLPTLYTDDLSVIGIASTLLIYAAIFQVPDGVQVTALGALRGLQDVKVPTLITFVAYVLIGLPTSYLLAIHTDVGGPGVWIGLLVGLTISASLLTRRFVKQADKVN